MLAFALITQDPTASLQDDDWPSRRLLLAKKVLCKIVMDAREHCSHAAERPQHISITFRCCMLADSNVFMIHYSSTLLHAAPNVRRTQQTC